MKHTEILKRAWHTMVYYRALWVFGVILALTTASAGTAWGGGSGRGGGSGHQPPRTAENVWEPGETFSHQWQESADRANAEINRQIATGMTADIRNTVVTIMVISAIVLFILVIVGTIAHYVSETSLIRMVNDHEETKSQKSVRQGFNVGWSRAAWKFFLIDLLIDIPVGLAFLTLFLLAAAPLLLWTTEIPIAGIVGMITAGGFFLLLIVAAIVAGEVLRLIKHFARRTCALDEQGVRASIRKGYALAREHLKDVGVMWLITAAVRYLWPIAMIPVVLLLILVGLLVGGILTLIIGGIASLITGGTTAWIVGGVTGGTILILILALPLIFLEGLREVFLSSTWTLTYRQLCTLQAPAPVTLPQAGTQTNQAPA